LLVEDDPDDQRFLRRALEKSGRDVQIDHASDGQAAMEYLSSALPDAEMARQRRVHLVLSDVHMPLRSGWEVLDWIRRRPEFSGLPVLIWTSLATPEGAERASARGAERYLSKPRDLAGYSAIATLILSFLGD
jgi:CheY-like chemotaxis protein